MKVAVVVPVVWRPATFSLDPRLFVTGFERLGHHASLICLEGSDAAAEPASAAELADPAFWRTRDLDAALVFTWLGFYDVVAALREAGVIVVSKGDTDGMQGMRVYPRAMANRMLRPADGVLDASRRGWHLMKRYAYLHRAEDVVLLRTLETAAVTIVETPGARDNLVRFLRHHDADGLAERVEVVRTPVGDGFCRGPVGEKDGHVAVSVGRWDDPQKGARLLRETLGKLRDPAFLIVGGGGERWFADLPAKVQYVGQLPPEEVRDAYMRASVCVLTSRWEGGWGAGNEAVAMGCTVVGPAIPALTGLVEDGQFGVAVTKRRASALAHALEAELERWRTGQRDADSIAEHWRARLAPEAVAARIVELIENRDR